MQPDQDPKALTDVCERRRFLSKHPNQVLWDDSKRALNLSLPQKVALTGSRKRLARADVCQRMLNEILNSARHKNDDTLSLTLVMSTVSACATAHLKAHGGDEANVLSYTTFAAATFLAAMGTDVANELHNARVELEQSQSIASRKRTITWLEHAALTYAYDRLSPNDEGFKADRDAANLQMWKRAGPVDGHFCLLEDIEIPHIKTGKRERVDDWIHYELRLNCPTHPDVPKDYPFTDMFLRSPVNCTSITQMLSIVWSDVMIGHYLDLGQDTAESFKKKQSQQENASILLQLTPAQFRTWARIEWACGAKLLGTARGDEPTMNGPLVRSIAERFHSQLHFADEEVRRPELIAVSVWSDTEVLVCDYHHPGVEGEDDAAAERATRGISDAHYERVCSFLGLPKGLGDDFRNLRVGSVDDLHDGARIVPVLVAGSNEGIWIDASDKFSGWSIEVRLKYAVVVKGGSLRLGCGRDSRDTIELEAKRCARRAELVRTFKRAVRIVLLLKRWRFSAPLQASYRAFMKSRMASVDPVAPVAQVPEVPAAIRQCVHKAIERAVEMAECRRLEAKRKEEEAQEAAERAWMEKVLSHSLVKRVIAGVVCEAYAEERRARMVLLAAEKAERAAVVARVRKLNLESYHKFALQAKATAAAKRERAEEAAAAARAAEREAKAQAGVSARKKRQTEEEAAMWKRIAARQAREARAPREAERKAAKQARRAAAVPARAERAAAFAREQQAVAAREQFVLEFNENARAAREAAELEQRKLAKEREEKAKKEQEELERAMREVAEEAAAAREAAREAAAAAEAAALEAALTKAEEERVAEELARQAQENKRELELLDVRQRAKTTGEKELDVHYRMMCAGEVTYDQNIDRRWKQSQNDRERERLAREERAAEAERRAERQEQQSRLEREIVAGRERELKRREREDLARAAYESALAEHTERIGKDKPRRDACLRKLAGMEVDAHVVQRAQQRMPKFARNNGWFDAHDRLLRACAAARQAEDDRLNMPPDATPQVRQALWEAVVHTNDTAVAEHKKIKGVAKAQNEYESYEARKAAAEAEAASAVAERRRVVASAALTRTQLEAKVRGEAEAAEAANRATAKARADTLSREQQQEEEEDRAFAAAVASASTHREQCCARLQEAIAQMREAEVAHHNAKSRPKHERDELNALVEFLRKEEETARSEYQEALSTTNNLSEQHGRAALRAAAVRARAEGNAQATADLQRRLGISPPPASPGAASSSGASSSSSPSPPPPPPVPDSATEIAHVEAQRLRLCTAVTEACEATKIAQRENHAATKNNKSLPERQAAFHRFKACRVTEEDARRALTHFAAEHRPPWSPTRPSRPSRQSPPALPPTQVQVLAPARAPAPAPPPAPAETTTHETACIICMDAPRNHAAIACGHQVVCGGCSAQLDRCPVCRCETAFLRLILS